MFLHNLQNVLVQIANKMGLKKKRNDQSQGLQNVYYNMVPIESERLSANSKIVLNKASTNSKINYACPTFRISGSYISNEIAASAKQGTSQLAPGPDLHMTIKFVRV
jgi:hypothetical protein